MMRASMLLRHAKHCCCNQLSSVRLLRLPHTLSSARDSLPPRSVTQHTSRNVLQPDHLAQRAQRVQRNSVEAVPAPSVSSHLDIPQVCSGCGVGLQGQDPDSPGYFKVPTRKPKRSRIQTETEESVSQQEEVDSAPSSEAIPDRLQRQHQLRPSTSAADEDEPLPVLCARCHSLRHYGRIISQQGEAVLPDFDLNKKVGRKLQLQKFRRAVVLCVVDLQDFDGSLPRQALEGLLPSIAHDATSAASYRLVIAANKVDLLPSQATQIRLKDWVYRRCKQAGLPPPAAVHLVSSIRGTGVQDLMADLQDKVGARGDVWVVGAQNAGKSSLINAMQKLAGISSKQQVTTAALPGTTLGMLRVEGILQSSCKLWDTPGVKHHHQLSSRLNPDEVRMLLPRRQLKPRTFRASARQTVLIGALARIDVVKIPAQTIYLTVWASDEVSCHYGRTDRAQERQDKCNGMALVPPLGGPSRVAELGPLLPKDMLLEGTSWRESSVDIAIAGLGWMAVGVKGPADLKVWVHQGVSVTTHAAILPDYAQNFERPGFSQSHIKVPSKQLSNQ